jgi:hypothetical protein
MLRQIATYVGDESFRQGLEGYLNRHAYGCASSRHLWEALEDASDKPVTRIMKSWVEQQGFPIVEVRREDNGLLLTQGRFTYLPNDADQTWWIPVTVRTYSDRGDSNTVTTLLKDRQTWIPMDEDAVAYKVNDRQAGFYRVRYHNRTDHLALGLRVRNKELASEDRWGLQSDLYAQVMAAEVSIEEYLEFLSNYEEEDAFLPLMGISENLFHAYCVGGSTQRRRVADEGCRFLTRILDRIGYAPERNERHTRSILRDRILYPAVIYGSRQAREFAQGQFRSLMAGGHTVHPDIIKAVMQVGALNGDEVVFEWFTDRLESSESEHDRINGLTALGCFREKGQIAQAQNYTLERVPLGNRFIPIVSMASNPHASPLMWDWFVSHLSELERFHPVHFERVIAGIVPVCGLGREAEVTEFLMDYLAGKDLAKDVIRLSIERLETNSRIRNR